MRRYFLFIQTLICYLFIVLFIYAAVSKLMDFETFQTQLGQSPLLASYAIPISYGIIAIELTTAVLLMFDRFRIIALQLSLLLMVMFTTYIVIILHFTAFTPCSCGGVLEKMGWKEHLIFNGVFVGLALIGIRIANNSQTWKRYIIQQFFLILIGIVSVTILYGLSEKKSQYNNAFMRKYIPHLAEKQTTLNLESTGYYIAGIDSCYLYLANTETPLFLKRYDYLANQMKNIKLEIDQYKLPYKRVIAKVQTPYFYLGDGSVGILLRGKIDDWKAKTISKGDVYYNQFVVADSSKFGIATYSTKVKANVLGLLSEHQLQLNYNSLEKQLDGTFESDGTLLWNSQLEKFIYIYYYKNQYLEFDAALTEMKTGHTIDTISKVQIDVGYFKKTKQYKLGPQTLLVNKLATTYDNQLYISTDRLGNFEQKIEGTSVIDQYDLVNKTYTHSFYLYHSPKNQLRNFTIYKNKIFAIVDHELYIYNKRK
ncbi:MauE/DoxX family redox-associated membrane protein [Empedobacter brevis]|uniref:DoxX family protein n=1 Tax=Empedobacter brevis TaxID=247 RepID=UPI0028D0BE91|nr:MauE/DoxX family redox-associated membrane protein [Empedobacter brevis]